MLGAILFVAPSARAPRPGTFLRRLNVARLDGWCRLGALRARRTNPNFKEVGVAIATIYNGDASRIDSARFHQIVHRSPREHVGLACTAGSSGIDDDVSLRGRSVLQLDCEVVKARLVIIEGYRLKLVEWLALNHRRFLRHDERRSHRSLAAHGIARAVVNHESRGDFLAAQTGGIDSDSRSAGAADDARLRRRDRPGVVE